MVIYTLNVFVYFFIKFMLLIVWNALKFNCREPRYGESLKKHFSRKRLLQIARAFEIFGLC